MSVPESTPEITKWCALLIAVAFAFPAIFAGAGAVKAERSGVAFYSSSPRMPATERVTRRASPQEFQQAVFSSWMHAAAFGGLSLISFLFYRHLSN